VISCTASNLATLTLTIQYTTKNTARQYMISCRVVGRCGKEIENGDRIWIQTHKGDGFDYKLQLGKSPNLELLDDSNEILHYKCHGYRERWG
jgi:hypothetical protein